MSVARIQEELELLRKFYPKLEFVESGLWIRILDYPIPQDRQWNKTATDVAFQIPAGYPGTPPYGIYVPQGLTCNGSSPPNANQQPPFGGQWGILSWTPVDGQWRPSTNISSSSNLLNWVRSFVDRFKEGL